MSARESAWIKPGSPADIRAAQRELDAWIAQQRNADVLASARNVWHSLAAAQIGARPDPMVKAMLIEDIEKLRQARALVTSGLGR